MKPASLKRTNHFIISMILICSIAAGYGIYRILLTKVFAVSERYAELSQSLMNAGAEENTLEHEEAILEEVASSIRTLDTALVKKDSIDFIKILESHAEKHDVFLDTPQFTAAAKKGTPEESIDSVSLQLRALGDFENLMRFIKGLGHLPFFLNVEKLQISNSGTAGVSRPAEPLSPSSMQATLVLKIFTQ